MNKPTIEQVLEWEKDAEEWAESRGFNAYDIERLLVERLCALAYAAGAKAENEACEKICKDEAAKRAERQENPLHDDDADITRIQGHKEVTAHLLGQAIAARRPA